MSARSGGRALVLAAHGSGRNGTANAHLRRLAQAVRARRVFDEVAVAFHLGEPGFASVLDELSSDSATVVPVMTRSSAHTPCSGMGQSITISTAQPNGNARSDSRRTPPRLISSGRRSA